MWSDPYGSLLREADRSEGDKSTIKIKCDECGDPPTEMLDQGPLYEIKSGAYVVFKRHCPSCHKSGRSFKPVDTSIISKTYDAIKARAYESRNNQKVKANERAYRIRRGQGAKRQAGVYEPHYRAKIEAPSRAQHQETSSMPLQLPGKMRVSKDDMRKRYSNDTIGHLMVSVKKAFLQERGLQPTSERGAAKASELEENIRKYFENPESVPRTPKRIDAPITGAEMKDAFETKSLHKLAANRLQQWLVRKGLPHVGEKYTDKAGKIRTKWHKKADIIEKIEQLHMSRIGCDENPSEVDGTNETGDPSILHDDLSNALNDPFNIFTNADLKGHLRRAIEQPELPDVILMAPTRGRPRGLPKGNGSSTSQAERPKFRAATVEDIEKYLNDGGQGAEDNVEMRELIKLKFSELPHQLLLAILKDRGIQTSNSNYRGTKTRPQMAEDIWKYLFDGGKGLKRTPGTVISPIMAEDRWVKERWEKGEMKKLGHIVLRQWLVSKGHSFNGNVSIAQLVKEARKMFEPDVEMESEEIVDSLNEVAHTVSKQRVNETRISSQQTLKSKNGRKRRT